MSQLLRSGKAYFLTAPTGALAQLGRQVWAGKRAERAAGCAERVWSMGSTLLEREHVARMPLPCGRRSPRGRSRWYVLHVSQGTEAPTAEKLNRILGGTCLTRAFALRKECWMKRQGNWFLVTKPMWPQYLFAESGDAAALVDALRTLSFRVEPAGLEGRGVAPLDDGVRAWLEASADSTWCVRSSVAEIVGGELRVTSGPLVGQEARVLKVDRHKRTALVAMGDGPKAPVEVLAIDVPVKR